MAGGRDRWLWNHTAALVAAVWTANPNVKKPRMFAADEFHPHVRGRPRGRGVPLRADNIEILKAFLPQRGKAVERGGRPPGSTGATPCDAHDR